MTESVLDTVKRPRVAIYGAGAMGTVLGAFMTLGGAEVELIARNEKHIRAMKKYGARIDCVADRKSFTIPVNASLPTEMRGKYDIIFLTAKQKNNAEIATFLEGYLADDGALCTTQNGLPEPLLCDLLGKNRVYGAVLSFGAELVDSGHAILTSEISAMRASVGGYANDGGKTQGLQDLLACVGKATGNTAFVSATDNLLGARWSKLVINGAFSGLSVVTGLTFGKIAKGAKTKKCALGIMRECIAVADALGVKLEPMRGHDLKKRLGGGGCIQNITAWIALPLVMKRHKKLKSGMLKDIENGRRSEIDYICGAVVNAGRTVGVETPLCEQIVELTHGIENGLYEISEKNLDFIQ